MLVGAGWLTLCSRKQTNKLRNTLGGQVSLIGIAIYTGYFQDHQIHLVQIELLFVMVNKYSISLGLSMYNV